MPDVSTVSFNLEGKSPIELEGRRREIIAIMARDYKGYDDPLVPRSLLQELVVITSTMRRKNAGPPKAAKAVKGTKTKATTDDLLI